MKKPTPTQMAVLHRMEPGVWSCAYTLRTSLTVLYALERHGLVKCKRGMGAMFSPRTEILFRKLTEE